MDAPTTRFCLFVRFFCRTTLDSDQNLQGSAFLARDRNIFHSTRIGPAASSATLRLWIAGLWLCVPVYWVALVFLACKDYAHVNTGSYTGESELHLKPRKSRSRPVQLTGPVKCYIQYTANRQLTEARHRRHA